MLGTRTFFVRVTLSVAQLAMVGTLCGQNISSEKAVELAERFVRENGYSNAPDSAIKRHLDHESIELARVREELLKSRRNTLQPKAVGVKTTDDGWGVAFDFTDPRGTCRVVTMQADGTQLRMQHKDGIRDGWVGSD
jgi:hypothetical protein